MAEENRNQDGREERELQPAAHTPGDIPMEAAPVPTRRRCRADRDCDRRRRRARKDGCSQQKNRAQKTLRRQNSAEKRARGGREKKEGGLGLQRRHRGVRVRVPCVRVSAWALDV